MTELFYKKQQDRMKSSTVFSYFWVFWSLYSIFLLSPMVVLFFSATGRAQLLLCVAAFGFTRGILCNIITRLYHKQRPYQRFMFEPITSFWFSRRTDKLNSFPSKHVASLVSIAVMLLYFYPTAGIVAMGVSLMAGWGRVITGYHYPLDVMAGVLIGVAGGLLTYYFGYPLLFTTA